MNDSLQEYHQFIDGLVKISESIDARRVKEGAWQQNWRYDRLIKALSAEQREILADMLKNARTEAIHNVLVFMTDEEYKLSRENTELAFEPYGTESYFDYVARIDGVPWPGADGTVE